MKNLFKVGLLSLLALIVFSSCSDDDSYGYNYYFSYGNIFTGGDDEEYFITLDNGNQLTINNYYTPNINIEDGDRVYAQYTIIGQGSLVNGKRDYIVDLYGLNMVPVKDPILQSEIGNPAFPDLTEEAIGNDPIKPTLVLVGGKYLTLEFWIYTRRGSNVRHLISLVQDNDRVPTDPNDKTVYLTLRHNGYADVPIQSDYYQFVRTYGNISFDITSILPEGETSVPIKLIWTEYGRTLADREEYSINRTYSYTPEPEPLMSAPAISSSSSLISNGYSLPLLIK